MGRYTAAELLRLGCQVDIICLEDNVSDTPSFQRQNSIGLIVNGILKNTHGLRIIRGF